MTDPLSEVLRAVRLTGGLFLDARFTAPWCVNARITPDHCQGYLAAPTQIIGYHFVIAGRLSVAVDGSPTIAARAGEVVLLPRNDRHMLGSDMTLAPVEARSLILRSPAGGLARIVHGGGGEATHIVCGFLGCEETFNPLIATLPAILKVDIREGALRDWVEASVRLAAGELVEGRYGSSDAMARLSELLLVEAVRNYSAAEGDREAGWLRGLADPHVGRALALIHQQIGMPWSADALAREVALSRSAFVERFSALIGMPPIRYLTVWRLRTAQLHLRQTRHSIAQLARLVGYESEEAFSRAFKREFGLPPARWREQHAAA